MKVRDRIAPCSTVVALQMAWSESAADLKDMDEGSKNALIAMKDFYKRMIADGSIHKYLEARARAAAEYAKKKKP